MINIDLQQVIDLLMEFATTIALRMVAGVILLIVGFKVIKIFMKVVTKTGWHEKLDSGAKSFIKSFFTIILKAVLIVTVAGFIGVPMTSVVALIASAGLAIGLALQGALGNFAGGLMILIFKPFKIGDHIDTHTDAGIVKDINVFYTVLKTFDNRIITMPNGAMTNASIINFSMEEERRVDFTFTTSYGADIDAVKSLLLDIADKHPNVLKEPEPVARMKEHGDSALVFVMRAWSKREDYWTVYFDITETVKKEFDKYNIEIPYPQMDIHMKSEK